MATSHAGENYINHEKGLWSWLTTVDHKRIGVMYLISVFNILLDWRSCGFSHQNGIVFYWSKPLLGRKLTTN
jgi:hypothetical protein